MNKNLELSLGFSPCPNDTFIFDGMLNGNINNSKLNFDYHMVDVETLNHWAFDTKLDITKLSFSTFLKVSKNYKLLDCGSALGNNVGPLLLSKHPLSTEDLGYTLKNSKIAIPGINTTANLLLTLAFPEVKNKKELLFSEIEQAIVNEEVDFGLVIHESRFTYPSKGLFKVLDLGEWWHQETGVPIPLGGIFIKRTIPLSIATTVQNLIKNSIDYSWNTYPLLSDFVKNNAQEMDEVIMKKHIDLYVNPYTSTLGNEGKKAIHTLFEKAKEANIIQSIPEGLFV